NSKSGSTTSNSSSLGSVNDLNNNNTTTGSSSNTSSGVHLNTGMNNEQGGITSFNGNGGVSIADTTHNAIVVKADPQLMRKIESAIDQLDIRRQQVLIEAAIIEVEGTDADQLGVQWALGDISSGIGLVNFDNFGTSLKNISAGYLTGGGAG